MAQNHFSIGELAEISGVTVRTIQYYDQIGLLEAKRTETNLRYYLQSDVLKLQQILFYKRLDFSLEEIRNLVEEVNDNQELVNILERQEVILFRKEMEIKMNQVIIEVIKNTLEFEKNIDLDPLIKLVLGLEKQTIMAYTHIDYGLEPDQIPDEKDIQFEAILEMYWDWKQLVLEATNLKLNETDVESVAGYQIGEKWQKFLVNVGDEGSKTRKVAEKGAEFSEEWPEEDLFLYRFSEDYIDRAHQYYLETKEGNQDD